MSRRAAIAGITLALTSEGRVEAVKHAGPAIVGTGDYTNAEYPPMAAVDGQCLEGYAWDFVRGDRCVSMRGWCNGQLWTCEGKPAHRDHPQFACLPEYPRAQRCARAWQPREEGVTPLEAQSKHADRCCWKWKPKRVPVEG